MSCRSFEFAQARLGNGSFRKAYPQARLPVYMESEAAGADFFCAEDVVVPSIWTSVFAKMSGDESVKNIKQTLVHTGIKANMEPGEWLQLANRSSGPKNGLILANGIGVIDGSYYENESNDGEIMFAFFNIGFSDVTIHAGERIGQGIFLDYKRPDNEAHGLYVRNAVRSGGFGSTGK